MCLEVFRLDVRMLWKPFPTQGSHNKDLVSLWDLIASGSIYSRKKHIEESFIMVIEANNYVK